MESQNEAVKLEQQRRALEMEEMRLRVLEMQEREAARTAKREANIRLAQQIARDEEESRRKLEAEQTHCKHRKGGKDLQGLSSGNSNDYSVVHHIYPNSQEWVMCTRCTKTWKPGDLGYEEALRWPTDNSTSGSVTFTISRV